MKSLILTPLEIIQVFGDKCKMAAVRSVRVRVSDRQREPKS